MPTNINGFGYVDDQGNKSISINLSNCRKMTNAEYQQLSQDERSGAIIVTDYPIPEESDSVSVTADGVKTLGALLDDLHSLIDFTKISEYSIFERTETNGTKHIFTIQQIISNNTITATLSAVSSARTSGTTWHVKSSGSKSYDAVFGSTPTDDSSTVLTEGIKLTLYYNYYTNQDIHTEYLASKCMMSDGSNVESKFEKNQLTVIPGSDISIITSGSGTLTEINKIGNVVSGMIRLKANAQITNGIIAQIDGVSILTPYITIIEKYDDDTILSKPALIQNNPNQSNSIIVYSYAQLLENIQYRLSFTFLID